MNDIANIIMYNMLLAMYYILDTERRRHRHTPGRLGAQRPGPVQRAVLHAQGAASHSKTTV